MKNILKPTFLSRKINIGVARRWLAAFVALGLIAGNFAAWGATKTWTGGAFPDANWSNANNWSPSGAPANGDALIFPAGTSSKAPVNDIAQATLSSIASVVISDSGYDVTSTSGATLAISGGFQNTSSSGVSNWRIKLSLSAAQTFSTTTLSASTAFFGTWNLGTYLLTISGSGDMDNTAVISGTGGISKSGSGKMSLANLGNNTYTGKTTVTGGTLFIIQESNLGANPSSLAADQLKLDGGTLQVGLDCTIDDANRGITLGASGGTISVDSEKTLTITKVIAGAVGTPNLTKTGPGALKLTTATSTYIGKTIINQGTLQINNELRLGLGTGTFVADQLTISNGATLNIFAPVTIDDVKRGVTLGAGGGIISVDDGISCEIKKTIAGGGSLTKAGLGSLKLSTVANTYTGKTIISEGDLQIDSETRLGANPALFTADQLTINDTATLNAFNSFVLDDSNRGVTFAGGTATISVNDTLTLEIAQIVTGPGALAKADNDGSGTKLGTLKLSAANTYDGKTTVSAGTLSIDAEERLGNNPASPTTNQLTLDGGTLNASADFTIDDSNRGILLGAGAGIITVDDTFTLTVANPIDDAGGGISLTKDGLGTLTLSTDNTYSGATTVSSGKLLVNGSTASGSAATVASGATLGGSGTVNGTVAANGTLAPGNSPGTLNTGEESWNSGGSYEVQFNDATGTAGADPGWDLLNITGGLTISASSGSEFVIKVVGSSVANFDNKQIYSWKIAQTTTGITGFATNAFTIDVSGFTDSLGAVGAFSISQSNTDIYLNFTPVFANPVSVGRAWGTFTRLAVSNLLANTTGNADRLLVSIANVSQTGTPPVIRGSLILLATTNNVTENFQYVVKLTGYDTSLATNTITLSVTNAVGLLKDISSAQNQPSLTFSGVPGFNYIVERSTDLANWIPMDGTSGTTDSRYTVPSNGSAIVWTFTDQNPPTGQAFYRLRQNNSL